MRKDKGCLDLRKELDAKNVTERLYKERLSSELSNSLAKQLGLNSPFDCPAILPAVREPPLDIPGGTNVATPRSDMHHSVGARDGKGNVIVVDREAIPDGSGL
jgi:hypothetical protein